MYLLIFFLSFSLYCFCSWFILVSCFLFFLFFQHVALSSSFLSSPFSGLLFVSAVPLFRSLFVLVFFLFTSFNSSIFLCPFCYVVLWCFKLSFTVTRFVLSPWKTLLAQTPNRGLLYSHMSYHNYTIIDRRNDYKDAVINDAHRKTQE